MVAKYMMLIGLSVGVSAMAMAQENMVTPQARVILEASWVEIGANWSDGDAENTALERCSNPTLGPGDLLNKPILQELNRAAELRGEFSMDVMDGDVILAKKGKYFTSPYQIEWTYQGGTGDSAFIGFKRTGEYREGKGWEWIDPHSDDGQTEYLFLRLMPMFTSQLNAMLVYPVDPRSGNPRLSAKTYIRCGNVAEALAGVTNSNAGHD